MKTQINTKSFNELAQSIFPSLKRGGRCAKKDGLIQYKIQYIFISLLCLISLTEKAKANLVVDSIVQAINSAPTDQEKAAIINNYNNHVVDTQNPSFNISLLGIIPVFIAFGFVLFLLYSNRRENNYRAAEAELQRQMTETEMKALRAQMNPHFIFNCLNSIYHFMTKKDTEQASKYLVKFSALIRSILENSMHQDVPLKDDIEALELYIQLEQMRLDQSFNYEIIIQENLPTDRIYVPPLILQPFIENSIWHGLSNKTEGGKITLTITQEGKSLKYCLEDNGTEQRENSSLTEIDQLKKSSFGVALTRERLDLVNIKNKSNANFLMIDLSNDKKEYCGKRIELKLPLLLD